MYCKKLGKELGYSNIEEIRVDDTVQIISYKSGCPQENAKMN
jgi:hypothetical protein